MSEALNAASLEATATAIIRARDHWSEYGIYPEDARPGRDQAFDDWAADLLESAMRTPRPDLWAFVRLVANVPACSNSEPDVMGDALDEITEAAAALLRGQPGPLPFLVVLHSEDNGHAYHQTHAADVRGAILAAWAMEQASQAGEGFTGDLDPDEFEVLEVLPGMVGESVDRQQWETVGAALESDDGGS